jgi:hypothetical protein
MMQQSSREEKKEKKAEQLLHTWRNIRVLVIVMPGHTSLTSLKVPHFLRMIEINHCAHRVLAGGADHARGRRKSGGAHAAGSILDLVKQLIVLSLGQAILAR